MLLDLETMIKNIRLIKTKNQLMKFIESLDENLFYITLKYNGQLEERFVEFNLHNQTDKINEFFH